MRFSRLIMLFVGFQVSYVVAYAQTDVGMLLERLTELVEEDLGENFDFSELEDRLNYYHKHPIDLNITDGDELRELRFVPQLFIDNLLEHRRNSGAFVAVEELQAIEGMDDNLLEILLPYVTVKTASPLSGVGVGELIQTGTHDLMIRYGRTLQERRGYGITDTSRSRYLGSPDQLYVRYRFRYGNDLQIALNMKKDAGESFFGGAQRYGFDFYSGSIYLRNRGRFKDIVLGDYALQFGQGLTMWTGLGFGRGGTVQGVAKQALGLRPYTSSNELSFLRGGAATMILGRFAVTPFVSWRRLDGKVVNKEGIPTMTGAFGQTGLHRTPTEAANRGAVQQWVSGANVLYQNGRFRAGIMAYHTWFDAVIEPQPLLRNRFAFRGDKQWNSSAYYSHSWRGIYLFGEASHAHGHGFALTQGLVATLHHHLSVALHYRNYQFDYHTFFGQAVGVASNVANEQGFYGGLVYHPSRAIEWSFNADIFRFPWLRYRVDAPSEGVDLLTQFTYTWYKKAYLTLRYRYRNRQENGESDQATRPVVDVYRQQVRIHGQYILNDRWTMRSRVELSHYKKQSEGAELGWMAYHDIIYKPLSGRLSGNIRVAVFGTPSYNSRMYAYENDVLYGYSFPVYHNRGIRTYLNTRFRLGRRLDLWARYATFIYRGADEVGSGLDLIAGNQRSDVKLQVRWQF